MAKLAGVVEAVSDDKLVLDLESDVFDLDVDLAAAGLAQEARGSKRFRLAGAHDVLQIMQRETGIDDIFDDNDVAPLQRCVEVFKQPHLTRGLRRGAIARDRDEVERDRTRGHGAREVGQEHERALQHGDEVERLAVGIVCVDLCGQLDNPALDLVCCEERRHVARTIT